MTMQQAISGRSSPLLADEDLARHEAPDGLALRLARLIPGTFLFLLIFILLLTAHVQVLGDADTQWHIAVGRWIWDQGRLPYTDTFSYTFDGQPWIAKEWLSQLILFGVHRFTGWWGIVMLTATCVGVTFVTLQAWLMRRLNPALAITLTLIAIVLCSIHFVARPHILVLPIIAAWTTLLVGSADEGRAPPLWMAALMVLWANMHGSFPLGLGLAGVLACEVVILRPAGERMKALWSWALFLGLSAAAVLVSPYGWASILVPLKIGGAESLQYIDEWQPLALDFCGSAALVVFALVLIALLRDPRREALRILTVIVLGTLMIRHVRFESFFGIISVALVVRVATSRWHMARGERWQPPAFLVGLLIPTILAVAVSAATLNAEPDRKVAPAEALRFARTHGISGRVYNDYNFGGFLIGAGVKTFVDGRTDQLFLGGFLPKVERALDDKGDDAFAGILDQYDVRWALVRPRSRDAAHLARLDGWSKRYQDDVAEVFVRSPGK